MKRVSFGCKQLTFVRHLLPTELSGYFSTKNFAGRMTKEEQRLNAHRSVED